MTLSKISFFVIITLTIAACSYVKKSTNPPPNTTATTDPLKATKPTAGVFAPGDEELAAIQVKHKDVTQKTLAEGYALYTGACTNCHRAKNIYLFPEEAWPAILNDMAFKARITNVQKDAVYKYVLAIKATQRK